MTAPLLAVALLALSQQPAQAQAHARITQLRYGTSAFPLAQLEEGGAAGGTERIDWLFVLIELPSGERMLVDAGIDDAGDAARFGIADFRRPIDVLRERGVDADSITHVILTHSHVDHAGGAHLFPRATIVMQRREHASFVKTRHYARRRAFFDAPGRVRLVDGDAALTDLVSVVATGGHTRGSQAVLIGTQAVVVGDECYTVARCTAATPLPQANAFDTTANRGFLARVQAWAREGRAVLTLHELSSSASSAARDRTAAPASPSR